MEDRNRFNKDRIKQIEKENVRLREKGAMDKE